MILNIPPILDRTEALKIAKEQVRIPDVWRALGLKGSPSKSCRSPWREDRKPSFSVFDDGKAWKDFSTDEGGDVVDFLMASTGCTHLEACDWLRDRAGVSTDYSQPFSFKPIHRPTATKEEKPPSKIVIPSPLEATSEIIEAVARSRNVDHQAVKLGVLMGCIEFATVCGCPCWVLTDESRRCAEARRISGEVFKAVGTLGERKAHTLRGSNKSYPVGITLRKDIMDGIDGILLVEGSPDFLAMLHYLRRARLNKLPNGKGFTPVAMLGRTNAIAPDTLTAFKDKVVRIYPHLDPDGGGMESAESWASSLVKAGVEDVEILSLEGTNTPDGEQANDINETTGGSEELAGEILPILPQHNATSK